MPKWGPAARTGEQLRAPQAVAPLFFSTSLDPQQTKPDESDNPRRGKVRRSENEKRLDRVASYYEHYVPAASATEIAFRHGRWAVARSKVRAALVACQTPAARVERFDKCGADCLVEVAADGSRHRLRAHYCGDRFCEPCAVARSRKLAGKMIRLMEKRLHRFVTLTLRGNDDPLAKNVSHLLASFVRLRDTKLWKSAVEGGVYFVEITRGAAGDHWHCHVHAIVHGKYLPQDRLSEQWRESSGGSSIVHVRAVSDNERDARYVAKYATKSFDRGVLADPDSLMECLLALRGRRMYAPLGDWRGMLADEDEPDTTEWKPVGRLDAIVRLAVAREPWALAVLKSLRVEPDGSEERPFFRTDEHDST